MLKKRGKVSRKSLTIGIVTLLLITGLILILVFQSRVPTVGEAYRSVDPTVPVESNEVYFQHAVGYATQGDIITIPLFINTVLDSPRSNILSIQVCFKYGWDAFDVESLEQSISGWSRSAPANDGDVPPYLSREATVPERTVIPYRCPDGWSRPVDFSIPVSDLANAITSGQQFAEIQLRVQATAAYSATDTPERIEVATVMVGGLNTDQSQWQDEFLPPNHIISNIEIYLVPPCPDADRDGYAAPGTVQEDFIEGSDMRACARTNPFATPIVLDCDDDPAAGGASMFPGNTETCDGLDNDCGDTDHTDGVTPETIDDGLSGSSDNSNVRGVCTGRKICLGSGMVNSYDVPAASREFVRSNAALTPFTTFSNGATPVYSFDVYESGEETICDQLDNDCDGSIDEGLASCVVGVAAAGARGIVSIPFGNTFIDYVAPTTGSSLRDPQLVDSNDNTLYSRVYSIRGESDCGLDTQPYCSRTVAGNSAWICRNGIYYIDYGATTGLYRFSPSDNLEVLTGEERTTNIASLTEETITCEAVG